MQTTPKWTAKAPEGVKSWDRIRFFANPDDYRCVIWPPMGPYWCSGYGEDYSVIVAYVPQGTTDDELRKYWPEAREIERMQEGEQIQFTDRFPKPEYWIE